MKSPARSLCLSFAGAMCALLAGCLLKPTTVTTRSFVLTPLPASDRAASPGHLAVGIGLIKMPSYLLRSSLAVRQRTNEIHYLEDSLWAEGLDQSFQRTLAANLATLLPTDQIRLSAWQRGEVARAVYVNVDRFDIDAQGSGTLIAWWRITSSSGDKVLKSGVSHLDRAGPSPPTNPEALVATLSSLTAEFSRILAQAIRESEPSASADK